MIQPQTRPVDIAVDRNAGRLRITWGDGHVSSYLLQWLRSHCPCATCREEQSITAEDPLRLHSGPLPSAEVVTAEFVGNYAIRFQWRDGHDAGIYAFAYLRASCPCLACNPNGLPI
jgi:DUF971 family protein